MRSRILVLLSVLLLTSCSKAPVEELTEPEQNAPTETTSSTEATPTVAVATDANTTAVDPSASEPAAVVRGAPQPTPEATAAAELATRTEAAETEMADLNDEYKQGVMAWQTKFREAKTAEARAEIRLASPSDVFAKKYLDLADKFAGTPVASESLISAMKKGKVETKKLASDRLLELAQQDISKLESEGMLIMVAQSGDEEGKLKASQVLADLVAKDPTSAVAQRIIPAVLQAKTDSPGKEQVAQTVLDLADQDVRSNKALESLVLLGSKMSGKTKSAALSRITEHHLQSDTILDVIKKVTSGRSPDEAAETWLKDVCRKSGSPTVKGSAAIALKDVIDRRDMYRSYYSEADKETRAELGEELLSYLERDPDPNEMELIETTLDGYVNDNESLLETAKKKLFIVKNLSVGKKAPEISGADLDGVDFKLSEYRGKVVFLDFWGDW